jgi:glycine oxidase
VLCYNNGMVKSPDLLIIGGGVIGLTTAYFLAREGVSVRVVDKSDFGQEASWAGAGILPVADLQHAHTPLEILRARSIGLFPGLSQELHERTGIDNGYLRCGGLEFHHGEGHVAADEWYSEGFSCQTLDETAARELEPGLASGLGRVNHLPDMAQVRNPRHLLALLAACRSLDVALQPGCHVFGFSNRGATVLSVQTSSGVIAADRYLIASGAWTDPLLASLGKGLKIEPVRGQIALLNTGAPILRRILLWGSRYLVPRPDGRVLVGSTEEKAGFDKRNTAGAIAGLLAIAAKLVPGLADAHIERCWAGLRPGSPDGLPFLGRMPDYDNLFIAAGHFRAGIQLSPGTALVIKECLLDQPPSVALEGFRPGRL